MAYYARPADNPLPLWRRSAALTAAASLHALGLLAIVALGTHPQLVQPFHAMTVRMLELAPPHPPKPEPLEPKPLARAPLRKAPAAPPPPVMTAAPTATAAASFTVAPQPEPRPVEIRPAPPAPQPVVASAPPAPPPIVAARFDADYLNNPRPSYPLMSRRRGEEGKVVLRVRVSPLGTPLAVAIKESSGYLPLDEAARAAVEKWRFVPARRGDDAVESTVLVPLNFTLNS